MSYAEEKLYAAVRTLTSSDPVRERLISACVYNLIHVHQRGEESLPEEARRDFTQLWQTVTRVEARGEEGKVRASVEAMDDQAVTEAVDCILRMFIAVTRQGAQREVRRSLA
jgi:hypothetical protein